MIAYEAVPAGLTDYGFLVKMRRFRSRQSNEYIQLQQAVQNLESKVAAMAAAAAEARRRAEEEDEQAAKPRRVLILTALCIALLLIAGFATSEGAGSSADPPASPSGVNSIGAAVQVQTPTTAQIQGKAAGEDVPVYLDAVYTQTGGDDTEYQVTVPARYAGKGYALLLVGSARVGDPHASTASVADEPLFQSRTTTCTYPQLGSLLVTEQCQLITGRFPAEPNAFIPTAAVCDLGYPGTPPTGKAGVPNAVKVDITGLSNVRIAHDWAYEQYSLPNVGGLVLSNVYMESWNDVPLAGWYETGATTSVCQVDQIPGGWELTDTSYPATQSSGGVMLWRSTDRLGDAAFVLRRRDADEIGNTLLAIGAAMAALAIGFIPVAADANRERRRARKRLKGRGPSRPATSGSLPH